MSIADILFWMYAGALAAAVLAAIIYHVAMHIRLKRAREGG